MKGILRGKYNARRLHDPHKVLGRLNIIYGNTNHYGFWTLRCPFHESKNGISTLKLHHVDGHYYCPICKTKGENILGFYMATTGKNFYEASTELGGWELR